MRLTEILDSNWFKRLTMLMVSVMLVVSFVPRIDAAFVPTDGSITKEMRSRDMAAVQRTLENKKVVERLKALGYSPQEIEAKVSRLDDAELHKLSTRIENVSSGGIIGVVIGVLLIILLVVLILEIEDDEIQID